MPCVQPAAAILRVADALERHAVLRGDQVVALVFEGRTDVRITRTKRPNPDALFVCLDSHVSSAGVTREGEVFPGSSPRVRAAPTLFVPADTAPEELAALGKALREPPEPEQPPPTASDGTPIVLGGPIPTERRRRCTTGFLLSLGSATAVYQAGTV